LTNFLPYHIAVFQFRIFTVYGTAPVSEEIFNLKIAQKLVQKFIPHPFQGAYELPMATRSFLAAAYWAYGPILALFKNRLTTVFENKNS
jgi:hypothetical protein